MLDRPVSRRKFTGGLIATPLGLALGSRTGRAEQTPPAPVEQAPSQPRKPRTSADYNKHPPIHETDPFAAPLAFERHEFEPKIRPFALKDVTLNPGPLQQAREWNRGYMMRLDNVRLLHSFYVTAGLPSAAVPLGGWEASTSELRGHFVGHYLSACALLYCATGDRAIKEKADGLVAGIAACQATLNDGGYVSAFPAELFVRLDKREKVWAPFYTLHKIMAGLFDMNTLAGSRQAMDVLLKLAAWVDAWTADKSEEHMQDILKTEYGGMSEVLYNLAAVTHDDRWARTGDRFVKKVFFSPLAMRTDALKGLHANTHMPQVVGAARRYELSSDYRFADVSEFFFETIAEGRTYATGGSANTESWLVQPNHLSLEMKVSSHHQECCCAYNMMKLARHLYAWHGDVRIMDYYERNLLNHRLCAIEPGTGLTTYFLSMTSGAWKTTCTEDQTFWCCTGSALEEYAKLNDSIYFHDAGSLYVNLYAASEVHWHERGIRLQQETAFPATGHTLLLLHETPSDPWTLQLRIPAWTTEGNLISLNGKPLDVAGTPGSYLAIRRKWKVGDRVEFVMPMRLTAEPLRDDATQQAFLYGPLVLAGQFPRGEIDFDLEHNQGPELQEAPPIDVPSLRSRGPVEEWIRPVSGQAMVFQTIGQEQNVTLKPLNQSWDRFAVYWTVS
jgi:DUF1680 family protein